MADLTDRIVEAADAPRSVEADGLKESEHSLADLIAADNHLGRKEVLSQPAGGIRFVKLVPPGA